MRVWRVADGSCACTLSGHAAGVSDCSWSAGSDYLATASDDKTLGLWELASCERVRSYVGHSAYVFCVAFNPASNLLASGSFDETVRLWEARSGKCIAVLPAHSDPVTSVAFTHDGTLLVSASYDGAPHRHPLTQPACRAERVTFFVLASAEARRGACPRFGQDLEPAQRRVFEDPHRRRQPARFLRAGARPEQAVRLGVPLTALHVVPSSRPTADTCC